MINSIWKLKISKKKFKNMKKINRSTLKLDEQALGFRI